MTIDSFTGEYRFLSNFYPCWVEFNGIRFPTTEHAYQAGKTSNRDERFAISYLESPGEAKRYGRLIKHPVPDFDKLKLAHMEFLLRQKFYQPTFSLRLLQTDREEIIEGNTWGDTFWGVCKGQGENNLGKLLMKIRDDLYAATSPR